MPQQSAHPVADQVGGGFVAGDEQQPQGDLHLVSGQVVAFFLGLDQLGDEVIAHVVAPLLDDPREVVLEDVGGLQHQPALFGRQIRFEHAGEVVGPGLEAIAILRRHPDHLGDHDRRQRRRQVRHQVKLVLPLHLVEQRVRGGADVLLHFGDLARSEGAVDQPAQAGVIGWIEAQNARRQLTAGVLVAQPALLPLALIVAEPLPVAQHLVHILVARDHQRARQRAVVVRILLPQLAVGRVGIIHEAVRQRVPDHAALQPLLRQFGADVGGCDRVANHVLDCHRAAPFAAARAQSVGCSQSTMITSHSSPARMRSASSGHTA